MHNDKECIRTKITLISRRTPTIIFLHCFSHRGWEGQWVACAIGLTCIHSSSLISLLRGAIKRWLSFYIRCTRSFPVDNVNYNFPLPRFISTLPANSAEYPPREEARASSFFLKKIFTHFSIFETWTNLSTERFEEGRRKLEKGVLLKVNTGGTLRRN